MTRLGWFGIACTILYLLAILIFQWEQLGEIKKLDLNNFGDFLAGAFGPVALFWLILGFFQQGAELRNSVDALKLQTEELRQSVAQQSKLASVATSQLELEISARKQEEMQRALQLIPNIALIASGVSGGKEVVSKFRLLNRGGDASSIQLGITSADLRLSAKSFLTVLSNDERSFAITSTNSLIKYDDVELSIVSRTADGSERLQIFLITHPDFPQIKSEILIGESPVDEPES